MYNNAIPSAIFLHGSLCKLQRISPRFAQLFIKQPALATLLPFPSLIIITSKHLPPQSCGIIHAPHLQFHPLCSSDTLPLPVPPLNNKKQIRKIQKNANIPLSNSSLVYRSMIPYGYLFNKKQTTRL
ncbi:hypothetical protein V8G54_035771 [Vigna mungo]|uniref:Uncharacterized protein n=1 Tax=Vigna mungo TaxID=3915 RepID=A0AAQ3MFX5_VIGMU